MDKKSILKIIDEINEYISRELWMDFEVVSYGNSKLILNGGIDLPITVNITIEFEEVFFVSLPIEWKTDTSERTLTLLEGDKAYKVNSKFQVEQGYNIFMFKPEYYSDEFGCLIAAKEIYFSILKD